MVTLVLTRLISGLVPENDVQIRSKTVSRSTFMSVPSLNNCCLDDQPLTSPTLECQSSSVVHCFPLHPVIFSKLSQELSSHLKGIHPEEHESNSFADMQDTLILGNLHVKLAMSSALSDRGSQPFPTSTAPCQRC